MTIEIEKNIFEIVKNILNIDNIESSEADLTQHGMESIKFIQIVISMENQFNIEIPDNKLLINEMQTISKMIDVVKHVLNLGE